MSEEESERWEEIGTFGRNQYLQGGDQSDPVSRVVSQLSLFSSGLESIQDTLKEELSRNARPPSTWFSADLENRPSLAENTCLLSRRRRRCAGSGFIQSDGSD